MATAFVIENVLTYRRRVWPRRANREEQDTTTASLYQKCFPLFPPPPPPPCPPPPPLSTHAHARAHARTHARTHTHTMPTHLPTHPPPERSVPTHANRRKMKVARVLFRPFKAVRSRRRRAGHAPPHRLRLNSRKGVKRQTNQHPRTHSNLPGGAGHEIPHPFCSF